MELALELKKYVASNGRIHPMDWQGFFKLISARVDEVPVPLILGGSRASDMAKRVRLLQQIDAASSDELVFKSVESFLKGLDDESWQRGEEPPSNRDSYGKEDIPSHFYLLLLT